MVQTQRVQAVLHWYCAALGRDVLDKLYLHHHDLFDTSNYPKDHKYFTSTRKKVVSKLKNECRGSQISEFAGLRSKVYSFKVDENKSCEEVCRKDALHFL